MVKLRGALIPHFLADQYRSARDFPDMRKMSGALVFIDVCRFTSLTEEASRGGHYGVEIITNILNSYYSEVSTAISQNNGEIVKFAGDAILACFPYRGQEAVFYMQAALEQIKCRVLRLNRKFRKNFGIQLAYHGMCAVGEFQSIIIGDPQYHLDFILRGTALTKLFAQEMPEKEGAIVFNGRFSRNISFQASKKQTQVPATKIQNAFLPSMVRDTSRYGTFSAELRNVAILFIHIDISRFGQRRFSKELNLAYIHIQESVYRYEGLVNKIDFNEKGMVVLCSFGFPVAHINDIERAVFAARAIVDYHQKGIFRIGITYSNIYCGILGAPKRYEYGVIGNGVNAAARLMMEAGADQIVVEELFVQKTSLRFEFEYLKEVLVKGFTEPIRIHLITRELPINHASLKNLYLNRKEVAQYAELAQVLNILKDRSMAGTIVLSGDPGIGKTFFIWRVISQMRDSNMVMISLDEFNRAEQLYVLNRLFEQRKGKALATASMAELRSICAMDGFAPDLLLRYYQDVGDERLSDEEFLLISDAMFHSAVLLFMALAEDLDLLVVDNLHWADRLSLRLLQEFHRYSARCNLLLSSREVDVREGYDAAHQVLLASLNEAETRQLLGYELKNLSEEAIGYIHRMCGGNPLLIVELCTQIKEHLPETARLITLADLVALERAGALPHTIENIYINRLNLLPQATQDLLKLAAIIGKAFSLDELKVLSQTSIQTEVLRLLSGLNEKRLINKQNITPEIIYIFSNNLMREAIYNTILLSEKRGLHKKIAEYYENEMGVKRSVELIANHYILSGDQEKALEYSLVAANKNFSAGSFEESSYYYQLAVKHCADEALRNGIRLSLIDSLFFHSEVAKANQHLGEMIPEDLSINEISKYHYLRCKAQYLGSNWAELCSYLSSVLDTMPRDDYYRYSMLYYLDALRSLNRERELRALLNTLKMELNLAEIVKIKDPQEQKTKIYFWCKLESIEGQMAIDTSNYVLAKKHFKASLKLAGRIRDNMAIRIALQSLGNLSRKKGDLDSAMILLNKARLICEKAGDRYGYMKVIMDLALIYRQQADLSKALQMYQKCENMARVMGNKSLIQNIVYNIGELYYQQEQTEEAEKYLTEALDIAYEIGDSWGISYATDAMGDLIMAKGELDKAEELYRNNLSYQEKLGDIEGKAHSLGNLGNVANARGDYPMALDFYSQNQALCREAGDIDGEGRAWYNSAIASWNQENLNEAERKLSKAEDCFRRAGSQFFLDVVKEAMQSLLEEREKV